MIIKKMFEEIEKLLAGRNQTPLLASPQWVTAPT